MSIQVTLNLPEPVYNQAQQLARLRCQDITEVLSETLALLLPPHPPDLTLPGNVTQASNSQLLRLTETQLPPEQDRRLSDLLHRQQADTLTATERLELDRLMTQYKQGLLQKAQALNEAVKRGLIPPLKS